MSNNGNYHAFEEDIDLNKISKRLWEIVEEAHPSTSLFDSKDFDPIQYINERFPDEDSLKNIESEVAKIKELISNSEKELEEHIYSQTNEGKHAFVAIEQAEQSIRKVIDDVENINAVVSERNHKINEITEDVRVLSLAKQNIESSLHMMSQLEAFLQSTQDLENRLAIKDVTGMIYALQTLVLLKEYFKKFNEIADIKTELERLDRIEKRCQSFAEHLFRDLFLSETKSNIVNTNEIYKLISILKIQQSSVSWYVDRLIDQYTTTLTQNKETMWIDRVDYRYTWLKKILVDLDQKQSIPIDWNVHRSVAEAFCKQTRKDLCTLMRENRSSVTSQSLKYLIERTSCFEILLANKFPTSNPFDDDQGFDFIGSISYGFREFLDIYVQSVKVDLVQSMERYASELKGMSFHTPGFNESQQIISSCGDLFVFYRSCLQQMSKLGDDKTMIMLSSAFKEFLQLYCKQVLAQFLSDSEVKSFASYTKFENRRISENEISRNCSLIATSDYCASLVIQLETKLKDKLPDSSHSLVDYSDVVKQYNVLIDDYLGILISDVLSACEQCLSNMIKMNWVNHEAVGDQSTYVNAILSHLSKAVPVVRQNLISSRKHFTEYCVKFVNAFLPKYLDSILKCKQVGATGAVQLLLDAQSLKMELLNLPSMGCTLVRKSPQILTDSVLKWTGSIEAVLKIVMSPTDPLDSFVEKYIQLFPEHDQKYFQKILEMKGLKRQEHSKLMELYSTHISTRFDQSKQSDQILSTTQRISLSTSKLDSILKTFVTS